MLLRSK